MLVVVYVAIWGAEAGGSLESGKLGYREPLSYHCMSAWVTEQDSVSKRKKSQAWWLTCDPSTLGG